ncbi:MAG: hypothetical protein LBF94_00940 [Puniceicoccales bacterium]|jgi:DNA polymerase III epsilon subunit-like protein|nr:hypothetical protein [Puniceicoccales bacterium]
MSTLHVVDFEGTRTSGIREYGVVTLVSGEIVDTYTAECTGKFEKHLDLFIKLRQSGTFAGHSASVEDGLLRYYAASPGFVKKYSHSTEFVATWGPWIDTKVLYGAFFHNLPNYSLGELVKAFGLSDRLLALAKNFCPAHNVGYHSAMFDALAAYLLLQNLVVDLQKNGIEASDELLIEYSRTGKNI